MLQAILIASQEASSSAWKQRILELLDSQRGILLHARNSPIAPQHKSAFPRHPRKVNSVQLALMLRLVNSKKELHFPLVNCRMFNIKCPQDMKQHQCRIVIHCTSIQEWRRNRGYIPQSWYTIVLRSVASCLHYTERMKCRGHVWDSCSGVWAIRVLLRLQLLYVGRKRYVD